MDTMNPESGYEKASRLLAEHPDRPIEAMLEASGGQESDWLEFKAGMTLLPEDERKGLKPADLYLDYALAVAAMVNTHGGAFVVGVDDKTHKPVSLSTCDPRHVLEKEGPEGYLRKEVLDRIDPQGNTIESKGRKWHFSSTLAPYIDAHHSLPFKGENIIGLLVKPCPSGHEIYVDFGNNERFELLPVRKLGTVGNVKRLTRHNEITGWLEMRRGFFGGNRLHPLSPQTPSDTYSTVEAPCSGHFAGRGEEMERLRGLLENGKIPVVTGAGGTGKSELVRQYAARHRKDYPGGMFQIDMEGVRCWEEAWKHLLDRHSNIGMRVADFLEITQDNNDVRAALLQHAYQWGPVFLALDNVESCEALFGDGEGRARMFPAGLANGVRIDVVATARVFDASPGEIVQFPLGDLLPEEAVELLLAQHPANSEDEGRAAAKVAELLGFRALFLRRVPAIIGAMSVRNAQMICRSYASLAKALEKDTLSAIGRTGKVDEGHLPAKLWELTREALSQSSLGKAPVQLVRMAAHFPAEGFPRHILRRLWNAEVFPAAGEEGLTPDEAFEFVLDACHAHNIFHDSNPVRIHRLDREAILRDPEADAGELTQAIVRALSGYFGASPEVWLSLAAFPDIVRQVPEAVHNGRFQARLLSSNPALSELFPWETLESRDWADLLKRQPQFADSCPWKKLREDLTRGDWIGLLQKIPGVADQCPWEKLGGMDWAELLVQSPEFADRCPWEKLEGASWAKLLSLQPQFSDRCPWEKMEGHDWSRLLCQQPGFADKCPWTKLEGGNWAELLGRQPQFADKCQWEKLDGTDWARLICSQPQFQDRCPWKKQFPGNFFRALGMIGARVGTLPVGSGFRIPLVAGLISAVAPCEDTFAWGNLKGGDWAKLIGKQPVFADKCRWEKLKGRDWAMLLGMQPQFADKCPWKDLSSKDWAQLVAIRPQFADRCPWEKLDGTDWLCVLSNQPQYADKCPWEKLGAKAGRSVRRSGLSIILPERDRSGWVWSELLQRQPQFAGKCPWELLSGGNWARLLCVQPQLADVCPWKKLGGKDWVLLLGGQPQFADKCPWEKLNEKDFGQLLVSQPQFADRRTRGAGVRGRSMRGPIGRDRRTENPLPKASAECR